MSDEAEKKEVKKDEKKDEKKPEAKPKLTKKHFLIIGIAAVVVIAAGIGATLFLKGKSARQEAATETAAPAEEAHAPSPEKAKGGEHGGGHGGANKAEGSASMMTLDPFIVNLQDNSGTRYLKLTVNIELASPASQPEITSQMTKIRDSLIILLSSKSYADVGSVEGKYQMREEIIARINQFLTNGKVKAVYFTDLVIQ